MTADGPRPPDECCRFHNETCVDIEEACCMECPSWADNPPHLHVIPVPHGATAEDSWAEITVMGRLVEPPANEEDCEWAVVRCDGQECKSVEK